MLEFLIAADDVVAVRIVGRADKPDVAATFEACREKLTRHPSISAYVDLTAFEGFAFDGLMEDIADGFEALGWWGRVRRKAVVTDSRWMHAWIRGVGSLVRQPEVKAFSAAQAAEALAWASVGSDEAPADQGPAPASAAR